MSVNTVNIQAGYVENPKVEASEGVLQQLDQKASAEDLKITQTEGAAQAAKQQQQGQASEAKKEEVSASSSSSSKKSNTTGELATNIITQMAGLDGASVLSDIASDRSTNPSKSRDASTMKKMGMASNPTSFEDMFKAGKKKIDSPMRGPSISEKMNLAGGALGSHKKTTKGLKASEESASQLSKTCEHARSLGPQMQLVKANIAKVRTMQGPARGMTPAGLNHDAVNRPKGYVEAKQTITDETTSWT